MKNGIEAMITDITATTAEAEDYSMTLLPALRVGTNIFPAFAATPC